ncbi:ATP-binding cassette domain-containing protein [Asticcacaulis solisilvae]|uniref:ATP-binding cassette domain-containing protein n=1 Tax=Asticcacaulis solisilvae TaxID=1217274 RepID=UPI003FD8EEF6
MTIDIALKGAAGRFTIDAAFDVPASGITAIWGASGSGKTTLLRAIAGLQRLSGHVRIGDTQWQDGRHFVAVHKRRAGYVFQEASLFAHLSVTENIDYGRKRGGGDVPDLPGLKALLSRRVGTLSGGERQRVALARAIAARPVLLLMDEPLSSLDGTAKADILPLIKQIGARVPILYVTHDAAEVAALADRVLHMADGRVTPGTKTASLEGLSEAEIRKLAQVALNAGLKA